MRITSDSKKKIVTSCNKFCRGGFGQKIGDPEKGVKTSPLIVQIKKGRK